MPKVFIEGPAGKIEGMYEHSEAAKPPVALVLHPHPLYGGSMNNKIAYHLYKIFINNGFSVLRINFRGVGNSQGSFDSGNGELADIGAALDWLHAENEHASHYWIGGFSFGAYVGMQSMMRRPEVEFFVMAAPPVSRYNFSFFLPCPVSGLIVQGSEDKITNPDATLKLVSACQRKKDVSIEYKVLEGGDHFFAGHVAEFDQTVDEYIKLTLKNRIVKPIVKQRKRSKNKRKSPMGTKISPIREGGARKLTNLGST